jgi:HD-GYP domain-containing protein (c-di-GMP phosphodiesterase class II)
MSSDFSHGTLLPELAGVTLALGPEAAASPEPAAPAAAEAAAKLAQWFGAGFAILDAATGEVLHEAAGLPGWDLAAWAEIREAAVARRQPVIDRIATMLVLALPWNASSDSLASLTWVACGLFVTPEALGTADLLQAALALDIEPDLLEHWARRQTPMAAATLERLARLVLAETARQRRVQELEIEVDKLSQHLCHTYEEISLIYQLTDNLTLSRRENDLARKALQWLAEIVPAEGFALQRVARGVEPLQRAELVTHGLCPLTNASLAHLVNELGLNASRRFLVVNRAMTSRAAWPAPEVREMVIVPLMRAGNHYGWLAAFNHTEHGEFGAVEANLLSSVSAILGIHRGNTELYGEQAELMGNMVQALTSAIDAKDPYTCGHSDRVARVSVRLGRELGCDSKTSEVLYLSGLLHDVGKIGIDDHVLRKPGRLTEEEFDHIKTHPQLGYNILCGIKQLAPVLPVVLHHHEAWDGSGYPHALAGEAIPYLARICAVADAFDAMGSDRVYRKGMTDDRVDAIIEAGAGRQWDPTVVAAFFHVREDIRDISRRERDQEVPELANLFLP